MRLLTCILDCLPFPRAEGIYFPFAIDLATLNPMTEVVVSMAHAGSMASVGAAVVATPRLHVRLESAQVVLAS